MHSHSGKKFLALIIYFRFQVQGSQISIIREPALQHTGWIRTDQWQAESEHPSGSGPDLQSPQEEASGEDDHHLPGQHDRHDAHGVCYVSVSLQNLV